MQVIYFVVFLLICILNLKILKNFSDYNYQLIDDKITPIMENKEVTTRNIMLMLFSILILLMNIFIFLFSLISMIFFVCHLKMMVETQMLLKNLTKLVVLLGFIFAFGNLFNFMAYKKFKKI